MKITKTKLKPPKEKLLSDEYKSEVCQELVDDTDYDDPELMKHLWKNINEQDD